MTRTSSRVSRLNWNEVLECWMLGYEHCTTGLYLRYQLLDTDIMNWKLYDDINLCMLKTEWKLWKKNVGCSVSNCIWYSIIIILILTLRLQLYPPTPTQTELKGSHKKSFSVIKCIDLDIIDNDICFLSKPICQKNRYELRVITESPP